MADPRYRHTQVGWVILISMAAALALIVATLAIGAPAAGGIAGAVVGISMLVFGWLSVEVDGEELRARFGVGLVTKRIPLSDVRTFSMVRNPWYWGWGIRIYPGGWLYNVSGFDAVELVLKDGRRYRIGTDDPAGLERAVRDVMGDPEPVSPGEPAARPRGASRLLYALVLLVVLAIVGGVAALVGVNAGPPAIALTPQSFSVKSGFYGVDMPLSRITAVSLEPTLPRILLRTNGYAGGGSLRGHFDVQGMGNGQLFVETRHPPFILVRTADGFVFVNHAEPDRTRALHQELMERWKAAAAP